LSEHKAVNSDEESIVEDDFGGDEFRAGLLPSGGLSQTFLRALGCFPRKKEALDCGDVENSGDAHLLQLRKNLQRDERLTEETQRSEKATKARAERRKADLALKEETRKQNLEVRVDAKARKQKEAERRKREKEAEYVKRWVGSKRPSLALSARMRAGHLTTPSKSPRAGGGGPFRTSTPVSGEEGESGWETDEGTRAQELLRPRVGGAGRGRRRTGTGSLEEIMGPRALKTTSFDTSVRKVDGDEGRSDSEPEPSIRPPPSHLQGKRGTPKASHQPVRLVAKPGRSREREAERSQAMTIMVSLPHMPR
jgi:hypothetical protein